MKGTRTCTTGKLSGLSVAGLAAQNVVMDELETLRTLVGPAADDWNHAQLEQLSRDMDAMAALLLDIYKFRKHNRISRADQPQVFDKADSRR